MTKTTKTDIRVGYKLRLLRLSRKLSQQNLAEIMAISYRKLVSIEKGKTRMQAEEIRLVCEYFDIKPEALFDDPGLKPLETDVPFNDNYPPKDP